MNQWMKQFLSSFSWRKIAISSVGLLVIMSMVGFAIYEVTKTSVTVKAEEKEETIYTHASTVGEVLKKQGIDVGEHDYIEPTLDTAITEAMKIVYIPAQQIVVNLEGDMRTVWTIASTVQELMVEIGVEVKEHDVIEPSLNDELTANTKVKYEEAFLVTLTSDGEEQEVWTTSTTVADLLEREEITLDELDRVEPATDKALNKEAEVQVVRVEKVTDVVEETIDYATVTRNDSSLNRGSEKVVQGGQEGKVEKHYEVIFEDGEEVSRELIKEEVVKESEDRVVAVGTRNPTPTVSRDNSSSSSSDGSWQTFNATAYTAYCNGCSGITATGINLRENPNANVIAVDPNVIPLGTRVEVKGYGTFLAADTGGAIRGNKIDIFMPNRSDATAFGRRSVQIRIVD
ncbi:ubiquitin-like domain-containing protein [Bacillus shivajii]|uniref:G5 and 3D domain-containing protein n=1 Tax=Bacillus shivajii TaxID=1983719 RepID=UPI001CFA1315|nr:G5 and 3D domain-containing protein [Bacillus shivajii]UCZ53300.1 ubiquitin-like domain-containing protein [Bacillus shivajii]